MGYKFIGQSEILESNITNCFRNGENDCHCVVCNNCGWNQICEA